MNEHDLQLIETAKGKEPEEWFSVVELMAQSESDECLAKLSDILSSLYNSQ
jgi:hypothetical protein